MTLYRGWGRTAPTTAATAVAETADEVAKVVADTPGGEGLIARGLGRSYGDSAQCAGGTVLDCTSLSGLLALDLDDGVATAAAGTSLDDLMRWLVPLGWFVPVTPGTRFVTVGGAIASDIHGKNHHVDGSFGNALLSMTVVLANGEPRVLSPDATPELFWATVGGMGLTGVVLDATFRLLRVGSSRMVVDIERASDLEDCMARMESGDADYRYSMAWIDLLARGSSLGRSVVMRGEHAAADQLPPRQRGRALRFDPAQRLQAPPWAPPGLLNRWTVAAFNELWFRKAPVERRGQIQSIPSFFHPLDLMRGWNRLYGPRGFLQHQCVVPFGGEVILRTILERVVASRATSFLTVLKRFGPANGGHLSFPMPGWTLNLDIPNTGPALGDLLDGIDELVVEAGGRLYLAKDSRMRPELLEAMYPRLGEWRAIREELDPQRTLQSDQSRRLGL
ncbi:MAG: FAD-binding oxidoreductase [Actinomycetota bacterium]|nr:FAD-binding oxidoreductase [Actinomycetota bacterium]